jgi:esterase/lipase
MYTLRTRFSKDIVCEFLPPSRVLKKQRVIIFADGMPSVPSKKSLLEFFSKKGFWVFHPRYRGTWESDGKFLAKSPHIDILDVIDGIHKPFESIYRKVSGERHHYKLNPTQIILVGSSFGGPAVILNSNDERISKVVAFSPVTNWQGVLRISNPGDRLEFIQEAFGKAIRTTPKLWSKLKTQKFYNPIVELDHIDGSKIQIIQAKDDPAVPFTDTKKFATATKSKLVSVAKGGHLGASILMMPRFYKIFTKHINSK